MKENEIIPQETSLEVPIHEFIYEIRGKQVMLDEDLAKIYQVETRRLNEAVKRNIERFPLEFMFQLTKEEHLNLISQIATSSWGGRRKLPFAFTEHGVIMLSSILNSKIATQVNIAVVKAFMKNVLLVLTLVLIISCTALGGRQAAGGVHAEGSEQPALGKVCEGTGQGYRGPVTVQVRMDGTDIMEIIILDSDEDRFVGAVAIEELLDLVIMYNSTDIDAVSGATESSKGFLEAVESAIMKR